MVSACTQSVPVLFCEKVSRWHLDLDSAALKEFTFPSFYVLQLCSQRCLMKTLNWSLFESFNSKLLHFPFIQEVSNPLRYKRNTAGPGPDY